MKLGIINSAFGQAGVDTATGLQHIARIGFDCVDIFTEAMTITQEEKRFVLDACQKRNLPIVSLPVVAAGLIDFNDPVRDFHVQRCKSFIDLAAEWDAKNILLVLGEYIWQREVIPRRSNGAGLSRPAASLAITPTKRRSTSHSSSSHSV
jgi:D-psicose/D-tagatose/L-ribulose 3-epimerase